MGEAAVEAQKTSRIETCAVHRIPFPQVYFPQIAGIQEGFWSGSCPECEETRKREDLANEFLRAHDSEIEAEARKVILQPEHQAAIAARTKVDLAKDVAVFETQRMPLWKDYNSNLEWDEIVCAIEDRKRAEFLAAKEPK